MRASDCKPDQGEQFLLLFHGGDRDMRVVANPVGQDIRSARGYTVVRVWDPAQR